MKKICMLTTSYPRYKGDYVGIFVHNLAKELVKQNIEVKILTPHDINTKNNEIVDGVKIIRFRYWFTKKSQKLTYGEGIPNNLSHSFLAKIQLPFFLVIFFFKSIKHIKNCDIIHAHFLSVGFFSVILKKLLGKKLIVTTHGSDLLMIPKNKLLKKMIISLLSSSNHIIAVSNANKENLIKLGIKKEFITVIHNGTYLLDFYDDIKYKNNKNVNIIWVGRMIELKGLNFLLNAMKIVVSRYPNSNLTLIGDGPLKNNLMKLSDELLITNNVVFKGYIKNNEIPFYLKNSDIFVLPSIYEGFGIAGLEAMSSGKAIVGSKVGGIVDIVKDQINGFLVEPRNYEQLAEKICYLIEHPEIRKKMGYEGRKMVENNYTWEKIADKTFELYSKILNNN